MIISQNGDSKIHEAKVTQEFFLDKLSENLVIIPAAGLGTRVGSPPAKELLKHPNEEGSFLEVALKRVEEIKASPLVISREDKLVLNEWLFRNEIPHILVTKTSEWVETVLLSQAYWGKKNILLLPDADFSPSEILEDLISELDQVELSLATFPVNNISLWGSVRIEGNKNFVSEKNQENQKGMAWGLIGFTKMGGDIFWPLYLQSQMVRHWIEIPLQISLLPLGHFVDLTRG